MPTAATLIRADATGQSDAAPALQRALDAAGHLALPPGHYRVGTTLRVRGGTRLDLHPQATLMLADGAGTDCNVFLLTNAHHDTGDADIELRGGIYHGNNRANPRTAAGAQDPTSDPGSYTGVLVNFRNVRRLTFADALLRDPETYHLRLTQVSRFLIEDLRFHSTNPRGNNDGVHLGGHCEDGIIRRIRGLGPHAPNDDLVALNADDALDRIECQGKTRGPIRRVLIHDLQADQCHSFVRLLSTHARIEDIDIDGIRGGCTTAAVNMDGARGCRVPLFDPRDPAVADGVGDCRDIRIAHVHAWAARIGSDHPLFNLQQRVTDLTIRNVVRDHRRDGSPAAPTLAVRHVTGHHLTLEGLDAAQLDDLRRSHPAVQALDAGWAHAHLARGDHLILPRGGFERLRLTARPQ